jgi:hypothetical protein
MTSFSKLQSKVIKSETSLSLLFSTIVVALQIIRSHSAFFYSDDYAFIKNQSQPMSEVFNQFNGHFMPITQVIYRLLIGLFGVQSYTPFLVISGLCNLFFAFSITYYLKVNKYSRMTIVLIPSLLLVVPYSAHTIFWVATAINLLPVGLLLIHTTLNTQKALIISTLILTVFGVGIGGYGLPLVFGLFAYNLLSRKLLPTLTSISLLAFTLFVYANFRTPSNVGINKSVIKWIAENLRTFTPGLTDVSVINLVIETIFFIGLIIITFNIFSRKFWDIQTNNLHMITVLVPLLTFVLMIAISRGGAESITASRYVVIATSLFTLFCLMVCRYLDLQISKSAFPIKLQHILMVTLLISSFFRLFYWWQSPLDINYQSSINRTYVLNALCAARDSTKLEIDYSKIDGLAYLESSLGSAAWNRLVESKCRALGN